MSSWALNSSPPPAISDGALPTHVAMIMDGNRRWAKKRFLPVLEGHRQGVQSLKKTVKALHEKGVNYLTVFAFSTENNKRPEDEVKGLMSLIHITLKRDLAEIHKNGVRLRFIGCRTTLSSSVREMVESAEELTANNSAFHLTIALNYGSQMDMTHAVQDIARKVAAGELNPDDISPQTITDHLSTSDLPNLDILVRSSGENRVSNFLLWELSYAELIFTPTLWPDFDSAVVDEILETFQQRQRRFGK